MRSKSPRLYLRIRELRGEGRVTLARHGNPRLYSMTYAPRYGLKTTRSTRRETQSVLNWAPYV